MGAPRIDENDDSKVIAFIDKYITCSIPKEKEYPLKQISQWGSATQAHIYL